MPPPTSAATIVPQLRRLLGAERCLNEPSRLVAYECDALTQKRMRPAVVVLPETTEEVQAIVRLCSGSGIPITPRGAGTCLSGGATPSEDSVLVSLSRMKRVLAIDPDNRLATVQPGVVNLELSRLSAPSQLSYAPDPSSQSVCTIGGNTAENSGGPHCLKYGCTSPHILQVEIVRLDGTLTTLGSKTSKASGFDLRGIFVGSEGTLGIATAVTCRLVPLPRGIQTLLASFDTLDAACRAVSDIIADGIIPAALEVLDERTIAAVEASVNRAGYPKDAAAVLLVELDGHPAQLREESQAIEKTLKAHRALRVEEARDPEQRARLWKGRKEAFGAMGRQAPDLYIQDVVVPRSKLPEVLAKVCAICDELELNLANVFHAGDGNLHPNICYDGRDPDQVSRAIQAGSRIVRVCLDAGGTLSGEHGIGIEKSTYMPELFSSDDLHTMRLVRSVFDSRGIMNPGKLLPTPGVCAEMKAAHRG